MAATPWICPRCGTPTNVDNCPHCLQERPLSAGGYNKPGSPFAITQGPQGYADLPRAWSIGCLASLLLGVLFGLYHAVRGFV